MKKQLRRILLSERKNIKRDTAKAVLFKLKETEEFKNAQTVFCYVSKQGEVDTSLVLKEILKEKKRLLVPKCVDNKGTMIAVEIFDLASLKEGAFGILEPESSLKFDKDKIDLIIVPGLCFDEKGARIGYGGGYYDRFLKDYKGKTIGLCFTELKREDILKEENDICVNKVIFV